MSKRQLDKTYNSVICWLGSGILHAGIGVAILIASYSLLVSEDKPDEEPESEMLLLSPLEAQAPVIATSEEPEPPAPEPPAPEPPAPEPPAPEPPAPEPPAPEPPAPEPPAPEPPKPVPPKPAPPKPAPPKPAPPKPVPPRPRPLSIRERLAQAPTHRSSAVKRQPTRTTTRYQRRSVKQWQQQASQVGRVSSPSRPSVPGIKSHYNTAAQMEQERVNYAEQAVKPLYKQHWNVPAAEDSRPSPVTVELDVYRDGRGMNARITRRSDDARMNDSVEELIRSVRHFPPFSQFGIRANSIHITVTLELEKKR